MRFGSVEMMISSKFPCPDCLRDGLDRVGASDESFNLPSRLPQEPLLRLSVQSAALRSVTSGMSSANWQGLASARRRTASIRRGVDGVRFATMRTRVVWGNSMA